MPPTDANKDYYVFPADDFVNNLNSDEKRTITIKMPSKYLINLEAWFKVKHDTTTSSSTTEW
jgi:hypothetical protein